ncbi:MAG: DUF1934 domain-containing protein [Lactobacillaceae bacterium]|jgi:uncharacterized beta-barrel protein YwiB (DUF1934 family)|nr:DUF1934 domain-containing protein [Lactobacillaceae bacterium]
MSEANARIPIKLHVQTTITQGSEHEDFTFDVPGTILTNAETHFIRYDELTSDGASIPVMLKINPDQTARLTRNGQSNLQLVFDLTEPQTSKYLTPMGTLNLTVLTDALDIDFANGLTRGDITVKYQLLQDQQKVGDYVFNLSFTTL